MDQQQRVLHSPFNIETHKKTFINYLEVVISADGEIMYAVPSHQEKLISIACRKLDINRQALADLCPPQYYGDYMYWLCQVTDCVSVWNGFTVGDANVKQKEALEVLQAEGLYSGPIKVSFKI
ncbi:hypothetical protein ACFC4S_24145 [Priestia megaterium]|uniref:hypothetical protein n=1 Tax=Priestia megaterium TaxID=1404 RepID=UPI0035E11E6F